MTNLLLCLALLTALFTADCEYHYDVPETPFANEDVRLLSTVIKGNNGKNYEVTMSASRKIYETSVKQLQNGVATDLDEQQLPTGQYLPVYRDTNPNLYDNLQQQTLVNNEQNTPLNVQQNANNAVQTPVYTTFANNNNNQYGLNPFTASVNNQQRQIQQPEQQQQLLHFQQSLQQPEQQQQQQEQQTNSLLSPQDQYQQYLQQPQHNNNLPNSQTLHNDLVTQQNYVSQSEGSQLDVYPYKQINGNTRPFTRVITKCNAKGQCEPQNVSNGGYGVSASASANDFLHQQVLKQMKAQIDYNTDKCQNKFNYQYTGNALVDNAAKAQRGIPIKKGTDLKNRRLIPYTEVVIPQYPHN